MKRLLKRALSVLLVISLLATLSTTPASAGTWGTYPPGGPQFVTPDGWALQAFTANKLRFPIFIHTDVQRPVMLTSLWQRGGESMDCTITPFMTVPPITIPPGTFKWKIEDESVARIDSAEGADQYIVNFIGLRAGRTVLTVTGPNGKTSKTGIIVTEDSGRVPADEDGYVLWPAVSYVGEDSHTTPDGWRLERFHIDFDRLYDIFTDIGRGTTSCAWTTPRRFMCGPSGQSPAAIG